MFHQRVTSTGFELVRGPDVEIVSSNNVNTNNITTDETILYAASLSPTTTTSTTTAATSPSVTTITPSGSNVPSSPWIVGTVTGVQGSSTSHVNMGTPTISEEVAAPISNIDLDQNISLQKDDTLGSSTISNQDSTSTPPASLKAASSPSISLQKLSAVSPSPVFPSSSSLLRSELLTDSHSGNKWDEPYTSSPYSEQWDYRKSQRLTRLSMFLCEHLLSLIDEENWVDQRIGYLVSVQHQLFTKVLNDLLQPSRYYSMAGRRKTRWY